MDQDDDEANFIAKAHIDSFNTLTEQVLPNLEGSLLPPEFTCGIGNELIGSRDCPVIPNVQLGSMPIMVKSKMCNLSATNFGEDADNPQDGGYFIINGLEKVIRLLIMPKSNHVFAYARPGFAKRGAMYTKFATQMRCMKPTDLSTRTVYLHYRRDGSCWLRFAYERTEYLLPLILVLKALAPNTDVCNDKFIFHALTGSELTASAGSDDIFLTERVITMLEMHQESFVSSILSEVDARCEMTKIFTRASWKHSDLTGSTQEYRHNFARSIINRYIFAHTDDYMEKFMCLTWMFKKLTALVRGDIQPDNSDAFSNQEALLPGQIFGTVLKENLQQLLNKTALSLFFDSKKQVDKKFANDRKEAEKAKNAASSKTAVNKKAGGKKGKGKVEKTPEEAATPEATTTPESTTPETTQEGPKPEEERPPIKIEDFNPEKVRSSIENYSDDFTRKMGYFLATGNLSMSSNNGFVPKGTSIEWGDNFADLGQTKGYSIVADRLNSYRFLSHFRSIHRGAFFSQMKTTSVRKLLPDTWGFLCPVHTPDGAPCGLLNHISRNCFVITDLIKGERHEEICNHISKFKEIIPLYSTEVFPCDKFGLVSIDGRPIGRIGFDSLESVARRLRKQKMKGNTSLPNNLEIVPVTPANCPTLFPGLFLFTGPCRFIRPVKSLEFDNNELIGPMEQVHLDIAATKQDYAKYSDPKQWLVQYKKMIKTNSTAKDALVDYLKTNNESITIKPPRELVENFPVNYTHIELCPDIILSILASLTPFSNYNQSPRNMYQCQMLKQSMGTPFLNYPYRTDSKSYKITYPQKPLVKTKTFREQNFDTRPIGTNAVVAVIAYTGFDMEDAVILNKSSVERGFSHASIYQTKSIEAYPEKDDKTGLRIHVNQKRRFRFSNSSRDGEQFLKVGQAPASTIGHLDSDGFPGINQEVPTGEVMATSFSTETGSREKFKMKEFETGFVEQVTSTYGGIENVGGPAAVKASSGRSLPDDCQRAKVKLNFPRPPIIGDKFASRHGQKGVVSILWPQEDMPICAENGGHVPDILFNPHGFPSRMTIGMLIESIAGKGASMDGKFQDCTTFSDDFDGEEAHEYFGKVLKRHGFEYLGTEQMYSGILGTVMETRIFTGIVHYQRLRHMVSDKAQVRSTGRVDPLTHQPIKGRKRHGGIRFGEMERDSLLAHGTSMLLNDRLMVCSDQHLEHICPSCGSILSHFYNQVGNQDDIKRGTIRPICKNCGMDCNPTLMPYVFRYLAVELAAMNIKIKLNTRLK